MIYLNGSLSASVSSTGLSISSNPFTINGSYPYFAGNVQFDEVRASNSTRSSAWITTEYNNQSSPLTFYSLGGSESAGVGTLTITMATSPSGLSLNVDSSACTAPCTY